MPFINDLLPPWTSGVAANPSELERLRAVNTELVAVLGATLTALDNMTTNDFSHGRDKIVRDMLRAALAKAG